MKTHDPIEAALARLMPPALSQGCQAELDAMFDELAGPLFQDAPRKPRLYRMWALGGGIAAAAAAVVAILPLLHSSLAPEVAGTFEGDQPLGALVLVSGSDRIESVTDEGWQENADGSTTHAVRLNVVEEDSLRDEETGIVMQVSEPREEILLMPVSAF